ncbi:PssD/Cps14F family polysaccharide biosynthesis glycosyltransferase [Niallia sp. FSL W8-0635]|uniref:PssD/Cps14F family polysaccharide biosynthesis glycosyltransferase n=1 Tax=Niallia sp. FSL W8-0635 TaxID=2975337 RepID=UPI0030FC5665
MKLCFTASSGGHLEQIMMLRPIMEKYDSVILTEKTNYKFNSIGIDSYLVPQINRKELSFIIKFIYIIIISLNIYIKEKPDVIISTGALSTVPICIIAKIFKKKIVFIESFSKINSSTLTGKLMYKYADLFIVQWEELKELYPKATYGGGIY